MPDTSPVPPIEIVIESPAHPGEAWHAITDPDTVAQWLTTMAPLGEVGSTHELDFGEGSVVTGRILELEPGRRLVHGWAWEGVDASAPTIVTWSVEPLAGGGCRVRLLHAGWDEAGAGRAARDDHERYWTGYLDDLRDLLGGA